ncbi:MAG: hypothetical protein K0S00_2879 [Xanthobacteraceae bacterium]|nr:hypothetical protein [Xanthobacteraceae bacterium]
MTDSDDPGSRHAKGGIARAKALSPEQRAESARKAAAARWAKPPAPPPASSGIKDLTQEELDALPFAKWRGKIDLGGNELDCYVLNDETRVLSSGSTTKAIANIERGSLQDYIGQKSLNPFIDKDKILQETVRFTIPGTQWAAIGITTEHFELICRGYVQALYEGASLTDRQREIAIRCAMLTAGLSRIGLDALVDEATGYQYERAEDALQVKLRAFISEELRAWEKTFPDQLWEEFGRLTGWKTPLQSRPKWWGKLVTELIYDTLDDDVAKYLKENKPPAGARWHQQLTDNYGVRQLVSRCYEVIGMAKTCDDMHELRSRVGRHYGKKPVQFTMFLKPPND